MRLLHVVPTYIPAYRYGGPIYSVHGLCKALADRNHDTHVFTTNVDGSNDSHVPLRTPVNIDGVKVWYFACPFLRRLYWSPAMARDLRRQMGQFDLVHLHSIFLWPTWAAARAARSCRIPYILAPRGMLVKDLIKRKSHLAKSAWIKIIERRNLEQAAAIHVTTEAEARECAHFGFNLPPTVVVPNGVDPVDLTQPVGSISPGIKRLLEKQPLILFLGRINWKKGLDRLIPALAHIPDANLVIAGNDEENYTPVLKRLANQHGVQKRITFTGAVRGNDKSALLRATTVFVLPSYSENFGNAVLEAMAVACPVVVTPEVGLAEAVSRAGAGLVTRGSPESLAEAVGDILSNEQVFEEMGRRGRRLVGERYSWPMIAAKMERIYKTLLH